jgi:hypothetical protein
MFVDPFLKGRLLREASRSIYVHMIGFDHEPELKNRLEQTIFQTKLYRRDCRMDCTISAGKPGWVDLVLETVFEIINQSLEDQPYCPGWAFAEGDEPRNIEFTTVVGNSLYWRPRHSIGPRAANFAPPPSDSASPRQSSSERPTSR